MFKTDRPIIGIVPDYVEGKKGAYSTRNFYALRENYVTSVNKAGGAAVILAFDYDLIDSYLDAIDGIVIVGGYFDINPNRYGEKDIHETIKLNKIREDFEFSIGKKALERNLPFFGICNGMQLLNVLKGGSAIQHIPDVDGTIEHEQNNIDGFNDYAIPYHDIFIEEDSKLFEISQTKVIKTNSSHHQATKIAGPGLTVSARAEDGIIEAIEDKERDFCMGVQWHPEFDVCELDQKLFKEFINSCKK